MNICDKFHWNPSTTVNKEISRQTHIVDGRTIRNGRRQGGDGVSEHPLSWGLVLFFTPRNIKHERQITQNDCHSGGFLTALECINVDFGTPLGAYSAPPDTLAGLRSLL